MLLRASDDYEVLHFFAGLSPTFDQFVFDVYCTRFLAYVGTNEISSK